MENVKTAREMFEKLGYEENPYREDMITYRRKKYPNEHIDISISKGVFIKEDDYDLAYYITLEELQAINKQIKELGWNNE